MLRESLNTKRPAEIVRRPDQTLVDLRPVGTHLIRKRTKKATLAELHRLQRRGYVHSASALAQFHARAGGGYGVKVALIRPLPEPMPGWAKGCALVGGVLCVLSGLAVLAIQALADLTRAAALLPWALIIGGLFAGLVVLLLVKRALSGGGGGPVQNNFF